MMNQERVLALEGGCNFRDLGGYITHDDRQIRRGILFRSGVLSYLTPNDHVSLSRLGIQTICDLRSAEERNKEPTNWPGNTSILSWDLDGSVADAISKSGWDKPKNAAHARELLLISYQFMPRWLIPQLQGIFKCLARGEAPLLFHCSAGKDRTGISAAIILHVLGVPIETILQDYELTNSSVDYDQFMENNANSQFGISSEKDSLIMLNDDIKKVMFSADPDYLMSAINKIESEYGSVDNFVRNVLNVTVSDQKNIRKHILAD